MDKHKSMFFTIMIIFCIVLAGIGGFFLGTKFGEKNQVKVEEKNPSEGANNGEK